MDNPFEILNEKLNKIEKLLSDNNYSMQKTNPIQIKRHFTKREAADMLSCSTGMIDKLVSQGRLEKVKIGAKVLIPDSSIDRMFSVKQKQKFIKEQRTLELENKINDINNSVVNYKKDLSDSSYINDTGIYHVNFLPSTGVYFLFSSSALVYIGQSLNVMSRIGQHASNNVFTFDSFKILPLKKSLLQKYESAFIRVLRPKFNGNLTGNYSDDEYKMIEPFLVEINNFKINS